MEKNSFKWLQNKISFLFLFFLKNDLTRNNAKKTKKKNEEEELALDMTIAKKNLKRIRDYKKKQ